MAYESQYIAVTSTSTIRVSFWIYLVDWVLALILGLAFIFYFHKLLGFLFSFLLRLILWRTNKIRIHIDALKVSPLGGRLFVKNITITTCDSTITIVNVTLTWRYWLYTLTKLSNYYWETDYETGGVSQKQNDNLPSRFIMVIDGLEIFIYNRTAAYDEIMTKLNEASGKDQNDKNNEKKNKDPPVEDTTSKESTGESDGGSETVAKIKAAKSRSLMLFLLVLPLEIKVKKGAILVGNVGTPSILVSNFKSAKGIIDLAKATSPLDPYRLVHDLQFSEFQVWMRPNLGYDKFRYGNKSSEVINKLEKPKKTLKAKLTDWHRFHRAIDKVRRRLLNQRIDEVDYGEMNAEYQWRGLKRYIGDVPYSDLSHSTTQEYARYSLILDSTMTRFIYYYDAPGIQTVESRVAPESGLEIEISHGTIHYGPWADRQRIPIQNMLFPSLAKDLLPTSNFLELGKKRDYEGFKLTVIVKDDLVLRIPTREPSKDKNFTGTDLRAFGWVEVKVSEGSNIGLFTSFVSHENKWPNKLKVIFNMPEVRTSVNHDVMLLADSHEINADIGIPLKWNGVPDWTFDQVSLNPRIFILREHVELFSDLFADFGAGDPVLYENLRAFIYRINLKLLNYELYLNVNDYNIINNPLDFNNNKYMSFHGDEMNCEVKLPLDGACTKKTSVDFSISTPQFNLVLNTPPWHTVNAYLKESNIVGSSANFEVYGTYTFYTGVELNTSNCIEMNCVGDEVCLIFYGFVIRYLFAVRENYFGDHIHFQTFDEFNEKQAKCQPDAAPFGSNNNILDDSSDDNGGRDGDAIEQSVPENGYWGMVKMENDVDVLFTFRVRNGLVILPQHGYSCLSHVGLNFDMLDIDMRFSNYYMDMQADFSPITGVFGTNFDPEGPWISVGEYARNHLCEHIDIQIDGFSVHSHRMFGAPPDELTFWCKWDFSCGDWVIDVSAYHLKALDEALTNFGVTFLDHENGLDEAFPPAFDAANFSFRCPKFALKLRLNTLNNSLFEIELTNLLLTYNDICNIRYSNRLSVLIPSIEIKSSRIRTDGQTGEIDKEISFYFKTSLTLTNICQKADMDGRREIQQKHVRNSDAPFHRAPFILSDEYRDLFYNENKGCFLTPLSLPKVAPPLTEYTADRPLANTNSSNDSNLSSTIDPSQEYPTTCYDPKDFTPLHQLDPNTEYDNIIVQFGEPEVYLCPEAIEIASSLAEDYNKVNLDSIMDEIEVSTVKLLNAMLHSSKTAKNFRVVTNEMDIHFGLNCLDKVDDLKSSLVHPTLVLQVKNISAAASVNLDDDTSFALHIENVAAKLSKLRDDPLAFQANINDCEIWLDSNSSDGTTTTIKGNKSCVGSADIDFVQVLTDFSQIEWLANQAELYCTQYGSAIKSFYTPSKDLQAKLIYALTLASIEYSIDHDPDVLTRPAYLLRSKTEHIRFFDSWKVMSKLRHILQNVPESWIIKTTQMLQQDKQPVSEHAFQHVLNFFASWRPWEANTQQRLDFLERIFKRKLLQDILPLSLVDISLSIVETEISNLYTEIPCYIGLDDLYLAIKVREDQKKNATAVLVDLRSYESRLTQDVFVVVSNILKQQQQQQQMNKNANENNDVNENRIIESISDTDDSLVSSSQISQISKKNIVETKDMTLNISHFHQDIEFMKTKLVCNLENVLVQAENETVTRAGTRIGVDAEKEIQKKDSAAVNLDMVEIKLHGYDHHILTQAFQGSKFCVTKSQKSVNVVAELDRVQTHMPNKDDKLFDTLKDILSNEVPFAKSLMPANTARDATDNGTETNKKESESSVKSIFESGHEPELETELELELGSAMKQEIVSKILSAIKVKEYIWDLEVLSPFRVSGAASNLDFSSSFENDVLLSRLFWGRLRCNLSLARQSMLELQFADLLALINLDALEQTRLISADLSISYIKLFAPDLQRVLEITSHELPILQKKCDDFLKFVEDKNAELERPIVSSGEAKKPSTNTNHLFRLKIKNDYMEISAAVKKTIVSFAIEAALFNLCNIATRENKSNKNNKHISKSSRSNNGGIGDDSFTSTTEVEMYGDIEVPLARVSVLASNIPVALSTILAVNFAVRLFNDSDTLHTRQHLQIESQFCRLCISEYVVIALLQIVDRVVPLIPASTKKMNESKAFESATVRNDFELLIYSRFSSFQFLSYNFCMGWLFNDSSKDYPGVIAGAEKFFAATEESLGKFTLIGAYLSLANGNNASSFFSSKSEKHTLNRAFLPNLQMIYQIQKIERNLRHLQVTVHGDEIDVRFVSTAIGRIVKKVIDSTSNLKHYLARRSRMLIAENEQSKKEKGGKEYDNYEHENGNENENENGIENEDGEENSKLPHKASDFTVPFQSVAFISNFAGSKICISRLENGEVTERNSLYLQAPAIKTIFRYTESSDAGRKLTGEMVTSSSKNTLYPPCVPIAMDLICSVKEFMHESGSNNNERYLAEKSSGNYSQGLDHYNDIDDDKDSDKDKDNETQEQGQEYNNFVFDNLLVDLAVRIERQELTLSCEPTAKVAAVVSLAGIWVQVNSTDSQTLALSMLMDEVSTSLQHIYSRDISASLNVERILMMSALRFGLSPHIYLAGSSTSVRAYINVKQYQDVDLFKDIWFPKKTASNEQCSNESNRSIDFNANSNNSNYNNNNSSNNNNNNNSDNTNKSELAQNTSIATKFKKVSTSSAFPWLVVFGVDKIALDVDFGQALGESQFAIDNWWAVSRKSQNWSQDLKMGIGAITIAAEGRLSGSLVVRDLNLHTMISWKVETGETLDVPLILVSCGVGMLQLKASFDYHVIAIANLDDFSMDIYNKKSTFSVSKDHLNVTSKVRALEVYITALTASNIVDISNTIQRMIQDNRSSYKETLKESAKDKNLTQWPRRANEDESLLQTIKRLDTQIFVSVGELRLHVYPSSLENSKVLVIKLDESRAKFQQNEYGTGISNELDIKFNDLKVSLSSVTSSSESFIQSCTVDEFTAVARRAKGGTIFVFPSFKISMRTFEKNNTNVIEYLFQSSFNGTVDIKWNLGSVNFIRDMYHIHSSALSSRMEYRLNRQKSHTSASTGTTSRIEVDADAEADAEGKAEETSSVLRQQLDSEDPTKDIDHAIQETMEKVETQSKFKYVAMAPPIIEAPQLKELGNATPPLEWFGLHRDKFPNFTHNLAIINLQRLVHEIEVQYSKMLGKV